MSSLNKEFIIKSPVKGEILKIENVSDHIFSHKILGDGIAIIPSDDKIFSPIDGFVETIFKTNHALSLKSKNGVEILVHIGIDTVKLKGEFFKKYINSNSKVTIKDLILEVDFKSIIKNGYDPSIIIVLTNISNFSKIEFLKNTVVNAGDDLIKLSI